MAGTIGRPSATYEDDFYLWTQAQAAALRAIASERVNAAVDWENVAEEIESMGRSDLRRVRSLMRQIMIHLIKLRASSHDEPRPHWRREVQAWRNTLKDVLGDSPSLAARAVDLSLSQWRAALRDARYELEGDAGASAVLPLLTWEEIAGPEACFVCDPDAGFARDEGRHG